jgi:hypothetical protein
VKQKGSAPDTLYQDLSSREAFRLLNEFTTLRRAQKARDATAKYRADAASTLPIVSCSALAPPGCASSPSHRTHRGACEPSLQSTRERVAEPGEERPWS